MIRNTVHRHALRSVPVVLLLSLALSVPISHAQLPEAFARDMKAALDIHDAAQTVGEEIRALKAFRELVDRYPEAWQPTYWTAYLATQVARLKGRVDDFPEDVDPKALVREAVELSLEAQRRAEDADDKLASDLAVLEGFVSQFYSWLVADSEEEKATWDQKKREAYDRALGLNSRNPLMYVITGINLFDEDRTSHEVMAGIALLDYAEQIFNQAPNRALTTYFSKDFIPFWRQRGEARLAALVKDQ